jgi:hypothetical protein
VATYRLASLFDCLLHDGGDANSLVDICSHQCSSTAGATDVSATMQQRLVPRQLTINFHNITIVPTASAACAVQSSMCRAEQHVQCSM